MQPWIRDKLDRIDELFPAARLAASRERLTRLWRGEPPLDRQPFVFYPFTLDYYDDVLPQEARLRAILDEIIFRGRLDDDFIPAFFPGCRQSTIPNMFGAAEIVSGRDYSSAKLLNRVEDIAALPVPSLAPGTVAHEWLEMARYVRDETEGRLPIHVADMQGPPDVCGKLWGYEDFLACAYEDPDAFRSLIGKVDGSAHLINGEGLIFLFNGAKEEKSAEFALTAESLGFTGTAPVEIRQEYPVSVRRETHRPGATVRWHVPPETAMIVRVLPENNAQGAHP
jgi:hypothetical protein